MPERIAAIVKGIAEACSRGRAARCSAARRPSIPGCWSRGEYDLAGAATGVVERDKILGADRVEPGDVVLAWSPPACTPTATRWSGTCSSPTAGWTLDRQVPELGRTLGEELLTPTRIYAATAWR